VKHIMMTSGGVGSFIALEMLVREHGPEDVISLFADTMMEDEDLYRFLIDTHLHLGLEVTRISDGRTPWDVFRDKGFIGNTRVDLCSRILKRELMDSWIVEKGADGKRRFEPEECACYVGIDWTEKHRIERLAPRKLPYIYRAPMVEQKIMVSPEDKIKFCEDRGVKPPMLYGLGFGHNNCGGFCVKAGLGQFKLLWERLPERYLEHEATEQALIAENPKLRPFLRKRSTTAPTRYMTMKEYREEFLEPQKVSLDESMDFGGCGCALDDAPREGLIPPKGYSVATDGDSVLVTCQKTLASASCAKHDRPELNMEEALYELGVRL
jgi:hypothetical protein